MNTKYNKDRILDNGWKRVMLNSVPSRSPKFFRSEITNKDGFAVSTNKEHEGVLTKCSERKKLGSDLSIVSLDHELNKSEVTPSTSKEETVTHGKNRTERKQSEVHIYKRPHPDSSDESESGYEELRTAPKSYYIHRGTEILSLLWISLEKEEEYIHYFRQLLDLSDLAKDGKKKHIKKFEILQYSNMTKTPSALQIKSSFTSKTTNQSTSVQRNAISPKSKNHPSNEICLDVSLIGKLHERVEKRRNYLKNFLMFCENDTLFEDFISDFISFEEALTQ